ncbi:hypothetical protein [Methylomonas sp. ZR1]|uniref:hypothetical protein n=1 Tax=Methylomonas sp. ZR1 TaxID=1797072 RepID=UPI001490BD1A|nr:hypothetical protein [Methylomonas sp. ZR1]NOV29922.1 hypothetical protein [Methylomonas sp. ZR1]
MGTTINQRLTLRGFVGRIDALPGQKKHLYALSATQKKPKALLRDAKLAISKLEKRITALAAEVMIGGKAHSELSRILNLLPATGINQTSAIALMGELLLLPANLS